MYLSENKDAPKPCAFKAHAPRFKPYLMEFWDIHGYIYMTISGHTKSQECFFSQQTQQKRHTCCLEHDLHGIFHSTCQEKWWILIFEFRVSGFLHVSPPVSSSSNSCVAAQLVMLLNGESVSVFQNATILRILRVLRWDLGTPGWMLQVAVVT